MNKDQKIAQRLALQSLESRVAALSNQLKTQTAPANGPSIEPANHQAIVQKSKAMNPLAFQSQTGYQATLIKMPIQNGRLALISDQNYYFELNNENQVATTNKRLYFSGGDCYGEAWIDLNPGFVFRGPNSNLYYTELDAGPITLTPMSFFDQQGNCVTVTNQEFRLLAALPNQPGVTGVDDVNWTRGSMRDR